MKNGTPASPATARASSVLPVPGRPVEQHALGDPRADGAEAVGIGEEVADLLELLDGLVAPGDVGEGHLRLVAGEPLGLGPAELHRPVADAADGVHQEQDQAEQQEDRQQADEDVEPHRLALLVGVELDRRIGLPQHLGELVAELGGEGDLVLGAVVELAGRRCGRGP